MSREREDWAVVLERLLDGDRSALLQLTRLVNSFLMRWNAMCAFSGMIALGLP